MVLIDTSVLVDVLRDATGSNADKLLAEVGADDLAVSRIVEMEILAGAKDQAEWDSIEAYLSHFVMVEVRSDTWVNAARLFFTLRRNGVTIRKLFDCCIAQIAIENSLPLIHSDRDFEMIASGSALREYRIDLARI